MARPLWFNKLLKAAFPQSWMVARMTRWPLVGAWLDHWLFEGDDLFVVPKPRVIVLNRTVPGQETSCVPWQVVDHFINQANYHWLMNDCICRSGKKCKDYPRELGCIFLGEASLQINPQIGRRVSREEALAHAQKCREAGLVHLIGRNKLDAVWLGAGPGRKLMTICNCCPCCCLWNHLPLLSREITRKITRMPGVSVSVNENCSGCGECAKDICFAGALKMVEGRAVISDSCLGCGRCSLACDQGAIELRIEDESYLGRSIERLNRVVDVS
jgi:ferredoxin